MLEIASLIVLNLCIAALIGFALGYTIGKLKGSKIEFIETNDSFENKDEIKSKMSINPIFKKNSHLDYKPLVLSSPKPSGKDNLKKIKGINSKIESDLNNLGIYHFEQIAKWTSKNSDWIEEFLLQPGSAKNFQWVDQAKILQTGNETIYSQKVLSGEIEVD